MSLHLRYCDKSAINKIFYYVRNEPADELNFEFSRDSSDFARNGESELEKSVSPASPARADMRKNVDCAAKRGFDILFAVTLIAIMLPLMLALWMAVRSTSRGPAIFMHRRIGLNGKSFPCLKFRSMRVDAEEQLKRLLDSDENARAEWAADQKLRVDPRVTPIGNWLRRSSLDELPQLFNILVGQMSVVGPRPIVEDEVVRYGTRIEDYCNVRPGLTGLWQISGRNDVTYDERVTLDVTYARERNFKSDVIICLRTVPAVLLSRGCY